MWVAYQLILIKMRMVIMATIIGRNINSHGFQALYSPNLYCLWNMVYQDIYFCLKINKMRDKHSALSGFLYYSLIGIIKMECR